MNKISIFTLLLALIISGYTYSQDNLSNSSNEQELYNECLAIMNDGKMLVDEYSPRGKCVVGKDATGSYRVSAIELKDDSRVIEKEQTSFMVAIKDSRTNTLWMMTSTPVLKINIEEVIAKCKKEDQIVFMTVDQKYSLSHHIVDIDWK